MIPLMFICLSPRKGEGIKDLCSLQAVFILLAPRGWGKLSTGIWASSGFETAPGYAAWV